MDEQKNAKGLTEAQFLAAYRPNDYEQLSVTVDTIILAMNTTYDKLRVLLVRRKDHPYMNQWALPGGFVGIQESTYTAAGRVLAEETGLTDIYMEQIYTMSQPDRDPRMRVISIDYMALIPEHAVYPDARTCQAQWFDITLHTQGSSKVLLFKNTELNMSIKYLLKPKTFKNGIVKVDGFVPVLSKTSPDALAFDHAAAILEGILRIRNKILYSDIAFNLVPKEFTLPDLQSVYETILGRELYKSNFKSSLIGRMEPLGRKGTSITGGKKSMLYRYTG